MNLKPNKHKRISFNTMTMASLGFIGPTKMLGPPPPPLKFSSPPPPLQTKCKFNFLFVQLRGSLQLFCFWSEILRSPLKLGGGYHACPLDPPCLDFSETTHKNRKVPLPLPYF